MQKTGIINNKETYLPTILQNIQLKCSKKSYNFTVMANKIGGTKPLNMELLFILLDTNKKCLSIWIKKEANTENPPKE